MCSDPPDQENGDGDDRPAVPDPADRAREALEVAHSIFQQVPATGPAMLEQPHRVHRLDVLREHENANLGIALAERQGGLHSLEESNGSGLRGLRDRVCAVGGELTIDSAAGAGTTLAADFPGAEAIG